MAKNAPSPEAIDVARRALEGLRARRCPWPSMRRMLKSEEVLRIGQGWEDLHEALDAEDENAALLAQVLPDVHNKYLTVGERYVTLYTFSRREVSQLLSPARNLAPGASAFSDSFPLPVSDASLESAPQEPVLSGIRELGRNTVGLVFCSQRSYEVRDHFPKEKMSEQLQKVFPGFDEVIAIRRVKYQAFDVVVLKGGSERIEVRLDQPANLATTEIDQVMANLRLALRTVLPESAPLVSGGNPTNLFPAIPSIYNDKSEGLVLELGFQTHTGSINRDKIKHRDQDLRQELFHKGGKSAVRSITPYFLCVGWGDITPDTQIELTLPGRARDLSSTAPFLEHAVVSNIVSEIEMNAVVNKLVSHL
jgi:hypothetical protein